MTFLIVMLKTQIKTTRSSLMKKKDYSSEPPQCGSPNEYPKLFTFKAKKRKYHIFIGTHHFYSRKSSMGRNSLDLTVTEVSTSVLWWPKVAFSQVHKVCGVRPSVRPSTIFNDLLLDNQSQISCGASLGRGTNVYINGLGYMTKMATTPIYCKNKKCYDLEIWHAASGT